MFFEYYFSDVMENFENRMNGFMFQMNKTLYLIYLSLKSQTCFHSSVNLFNQLLNNMGKILFTEKLSKKLMIKNTE